MIKPVTSLLAVLCLCVCACTRPQKDIQTQKDTTAAQTINTMQSFITIVEIPVENLPRAIAFYQSILGIKIEVMDMDGLKLGLFPATAQGPFVQLVHGGDYKPAADGAVVYLNGGNDLQNVLSKIEMHGGKIVTPKTAIGPDMGFYAIFTDTEANKLGIHSPE